MIVVSRISSTGPVDTSSLSQLRQVADSKAVNVSLKQKK